MPPKKQAAADDDEQELPNDTGPEMNDDDSELLLSYNIISL